MAADAVGNVYLVDNSNRVRVVRPKVLISIPLGSSGETVSLEVAADGSLFRDGMPVLEGGKVTAGNGDVYALSTLPTGLFVASYVSQTQSVELADGVSITLSRDEAGTWSAGGAPVENGHVHVREGQEYVLELADGGWRLARYGIRSAAGSTAVTDGVAAVAGSLYLPSGVAVDPAGTVYVGDFLNHRVRKIDPAGIISTVAGKGDPGYGGDGGPASEALLSNPFGVAVDGVGNLYVAEFRNHRVRRIDGVTGIISALAGTGEWGYGGDGSPAAEALLASPSGVAVDTSGNAYVADSSNHRIRRVDASTGTISTLAGTGMRGFGGDGGPASEALLSRPFGVAVDGAGNVYVADSINNRVRLIDAVTGIVTTLAGTGERGYAGDGGPAAEALLASPYGVALDVTGNVYVADSSNNQVRRIDASTRPVTTVAGDGNPGFSGNDGPAAEARLSFPVGAAVDTAGNVYVADADNHRIRRVDASTGIITAFAGTGDPTGGWDGGPADEARLLRPRLLAVDGVKNIFFADSNRIWKLHAAGMVTPLAGTGEWGYAGDGGPATEALLSYPRGAVPDAEGNLYVADSDNHRIRRIDSSTAVITTIAGTGERGYAGDGGPASEAVLGYPTGVAVDTPGNVYVADSANHRIRRIDASTGVMTTVAGTGDFGYGGDGGRASEAMLASPRGVAVDAPGILFVADSANRRLRRIDASAGNIATISETEGFSPEDIAADAGGNVYLGGRNRILMIDSEGAVSVIAGTGNAGFSGDGAPAGGAQLSVSGIAADSSDVVWFADPIGRRIRVLEPWGSRN